MAVVEVAEDAILSTRVRISGSLSDDVARGLDSALSRHRATRSRGIRFLRSGGRVERWANLRDCGKLEKSRAPRGWEHDRSPASGLNVSPWPAVPQGRFREGQHHCFGAASFGLPTAAASCQSRPWVWDAGSCTRPMVRPEAGAPYGVHLVNGGKRDGARFEPLLLVPKIGVEPIRP